MNDIFRPLLRKFVLVFFDEILIYGKGEQEHVEHVARVLHVSGRMNWKCDFGVA